MFYQKKCRLCQKELPEKPLITYTGMPSSAQYLPKKIDLKKDTGLTLTIYQCSECSLVQLGNKPVHYYKEVIRATSFSSEMISFRKKQFSQFINNYNLTNKKIIEIGCGTGDYLKIINDLNIKAFGIEKGKSSIKTCIENGLNVFEDFIATPCHKIKGAPYDAFFMMSFLEHLPNPSKTLRGIANNLSKNGVGIIEVPNFNMIIKNNLCSEFISDHLTYFTKETLSLLLNTNGFEIIQSDEVWHNYIISAIVKKKKTIDIKRFSNYKENISQQLLNFVDKYPKGQVAIWGAGHQSFTLIAMTKLHKKIDYIIDSATFKQGHFSPSTHIPIVSPDILRSKKIKAIIIIAGSYSNEIKEIMKKQYPSSINTLCIQDLI